MATQQSVLDVTTGKIIQPDQLVQISGKDVIFRNERTKQPECKVTMQDGLIKSYVIQDGNWIPSTQQRQQIIETPQTFPEFAQCDNLTIQPGNCAIKLNSQDVLRLRPGYAYLQSNSIQIDNNSTLQLELNAHYGMGIKDIQTGKSQFWMCPSQLYLYGKSIKGLQESTELDSAVTLKQLKNARCDTMSVAGTIDISDKTYLKKPAEYQQRPDLFEQKTIPDVQYVKELFGQYTCNRRHGVLDNCFQISANETISSSKLKYKNTPIITNDLDLPHKKYISDNFATKQYISDNFDTKQIMQDNYAAKQHTHDISNITNARYKYAILQQIGGQWSITKSVGDAIVQLTDNQFILGAGSYQLQWKLLANNNLQQPSAVKISIRAGGIEILPYQMTYCGSICGEQMIDFSCILLLNETTAPNIQIQCEDTINVGFCQVYVSEL